MNLKLIITILVASALFLAGCSKKSGSSDKIGNRWYTKEQVTKGQELFANNCAVCHGQKAESTPNWRKKLSDGSYPPPPLNGTAHA